MLGWTVALLVVASSAAVVDIHMEKSHGYR